MSEYKLVPSADLLYCTFRSISSFILHQSSCVNTSWKAYTTSYQIYNTKAIDLHRRVNNSDENSSIRLTASLESLSVREQSIIPRTRVGLGRSAPILHVVYSVVSALDPFSMRGHAQECRTIVVHLGKSKLDRWALLEIWHLWRIFGSSGALRQNNDNFAGRAPFWSNFTILESAKHRGCYFSHRSLPHLVLVILLDAEAGTTNENL